MAPSKRLKDIEEHQVDAKQLRGVGRSSCEETLREQKRVKKDRQNGVKKVVPKCPQNGLLGGSKKAPKMAPLDPQSLDTCSRKKRFPETFLCMEREGR